MKGPRRGEEWHDAGFFTQTGGTGLAPLLSLHGKEAEHLEGLGMESDQVKEEQGFYLMNEHIKENMETLGSSREKEMGGLRSK